MHYLDFQMKSLFKLLIFLISSFNVFAGEIRITVTDQDGTTKIVKHTYEDVKEKLNKQGKKYYADSKYNEVLDQLKYYEKVMDDNEKLMKEDLKNMQ